MQAMYKIKCCIQISNYLLHENNFHLTKTFYEHYKKTCKCKNSRTLVNSDDTNINNHVCHVDHV